MRRASFIAALLLYVGVATAQPQPVVTKFSLNEATTTTWPIDFTNQAGAPVTPLTASYTIETLVGTVLVAPTAITPLASHVDVPVAALTFPLAETVVGNSALPPMVPAAFVVTYTWGAAETRSDFVWFSLVNVP